MISAYEKKRILLEEVTDEYLNNYIQKTLIASTPKTVRGYIKEYLAKNKCNEEVTNFLKDYLTNFNLLQKTQICSDGSFRNCCILIRPDGCMPTGYHYIKGGDIKDHLNVYKQEAETVFLNMTSETWVEVNEWFKEIDDLYNDDEYLDFDN